VKSQLSNKIDDQWLNDRLVTFIKKDVLWKINNNVILAHFQQINDRHLIFSINLIATTIFNITFIVNLSKILVTLIIYIWIHPYFHHMFVLQL
jgi:ABC-type uncharacterized transport system fused permease/ATPase subunit